MPHRTDIEYADYSSNPLRASLGAKRGWSCAKISPGCLNCYAETLNGRFGTGTAYTVEGTRRVNHYLDPSEFRHILTFKPKGPFKNGRNRPAVFMCDMTDVFGDWVPSTYLDILFAHFAARPDVDFLVLTKRPKRAFEWMAGLQAAADDHAPRTVSKQFTPAQVLNLRMFAGAPIPGGILGRAIEPTWPLPNVWLGVSVEDQQRADERIPWLLNTPAAVRFLSCEPLLGAVDLNLRIPYGDPGDRDQGYSFWNALTGFRTHKAGGWTDSPPRKIDLAIIGGESGRGSRACDITNIRSLVNQCKAAGAAAFVKQLGSVPIESVTGNAADLLYPAGVPKGLEVEGTYARTTSLSLNDSKGGDWSEFPEDLRVREMPEVARA